MSVWEDGLSPVFAEWNRPSPSAHVLPQRGPAIREHVGLWQRDLSNTLAVEHACLSQEIYISMAESDEYLHLLPHCTQRLDPNDALWVNPEELLTLLYR